MNYVNNHIKQDGFLTPPHGCLNRKNNVTCRRSEREGGGRECDNVILQALKKHLKLMKIYLFSYGC